MLNMNIAAAPQVKSSTDNPVIASNSVSNDTQQPAEKEFAKVLEREVSSSTHQGETSTATAKITESLEKDTPSETNSLIINASSDTSGTNIPTNNLFVDITNIEQSLIQLSIMNPGISTTAATLPATLSGLPQNTLIAQDNKLATNPLLLTNQILLQKFTPVTSATDSLTSNFVYSPNDFWQSLDMADPAVSGKLLPFSSEINDASQISAKETIFSATIESVTPQSPSLSSTTSAPSSHPGTQNTQVDLAVGQPKWGSEFAQKIIWLTSQQHQVAEIHLNPAHLGPVEVMLSITQDQATAQFLSPHPAVREAIEEALPRLREMMAENGIQLGDVLVSADSFQQENRQQQAYNPVRNITNTTSTQTEVIHQIETTVASNKHHGIVNTYA